MELFSEEIPISFQLAQLLRSQIIRGEYKVGARLSPEVQLASRYAVSVITVQRALRFLEEEGLISRHRGRGTFVLELPAHLSTPRTPTAMEMMFSDDFDNDVEVLERGKIATPAAFLEGFGTSEIYCVRRLVRRGGRPFNYSLNFVREDIGKRLKKKDLLRYPMFRIIRDRLHLPAAKVDVSLQAMPASSEVSRFLGIHSTIPVLYFVGALLGPNNEVLNICEIYFRGDQFAFRFAQNLSLDCEQC